MTKRDETLVITPVDFAKLINEDKTALAEYYHCQKKHGIVVFYNTGITQGEVDYLDKFTNEMGDQAAQILAEDGRTNFGQNGVTLEGEEVHDGAQSADQKIYCSFCPKTGAGLPTRFKPNWLPVIKVARRLHEINVQDMRAWEEMIGASVAKGIPEQMDIGGKSFTICRLNWYPSGNGNTQTHYDTGINAALILKPGYYIEIGGVRYFIEIAHGYQGPFIAKNFGRAASLYYFEDLSAATKHGAIVLKEQGDQPRCNAVVFSNVRTGLTFSNDVDFYDAESNTPELNLRGMDIYEWCAREFGRFGVAEDIPSRQPI